MVRVVMYTSENNMVKMMAAMRRTRFMGGKIHRKGSAMKAPK